MLTPESIELVVLSVTVSTLMVVGAWAACRVALRLYHTFKEEPPGDWSARAFDASEVVLRIEQVRRDYLSYMARIPNVVAGKRERVETARQSVSQRGYFHHATPESPAPEQLSGIA